MSNRLLTSVLSLSDGARSASCTPILVVVVAKSSASTQSRDHVTGVRTQRTREKQSLQNWIPCRGSTPSFRSLDTNVITIFLSARKPLPSKTKISLNNTLPRGLPRKHFYQLQAGASKIILLLAPAGAMLASTEIE